MGKQKSAAAAGAVATGPVPRPPVLEHTTAELVSLIANLSEREDFTVDILGQAFAQASLLRLLAWLWSGPRPRDHSPARSAPFGAAAAAQASPLPRIPS